MANISGRLVGVARRVGSTTKTCLAAGGLVWLGSTVLEKKVERDLAADVSSRTNRGGKVLVLPFYRMSVVEKKKKGLDSIFPSLSNLQVGSKERRVEIELAELLEIIDEASKDPTIDRLHGIFGMGGGFSCGGISHVEEIRNAIQAFNQSRDDEDPKKKDADRSVAFADTFNNSSGGNPEYFLASSFDKVTMQQEGEVSLFGPSMSVPFFKGALEQYGLRPIVISIGKFKNAGNSLTKTAFTREHRENSTSLLQSINESLCQAIVSSPRKLSPDFNINGFASIATSGSLGGDEALGLNLIDSLTTIDPLEANQMLLLEKSGDGMEDFKSREGGEDPEAYVESAISLQDYRRMIGGRRSKQDQMFKRHRKISYLGDKSSATKVILTVLGMEAPHYNLEPAQYEIHKGLLGREKIACLRVTGTITSTMAMELINDIREIKRDADVKSVVLRVDSGGGSATASEMIYRELESLAKTKPIVTSFGNVAASGGYYVAANSRRIFASPTTLTGSIGVFGIKLDATKFAKKYGFNVEHLGSEFAHAASPLSKLSPRVEASLRKRMSATYDTFKTVVSVGRKLPPEKVEQHAQGRVFTGRQALDCGLVDELGGFHQAIEFAKQFTSEGDAKVEYYPKPPTISEILSKMIGGKESSTINLVSFLLEGIVGRDGATHELLSSIHFTDEIFLTIDENEAIRATLGKCL